jgi:hypothetical protein
MPIVHLLVAAAAAGAPQPCGLIFPVAPDEAAARRIAKSTLAAGPVRHPNRRYALKVRPDPEDPGRWIAYQSQPPPRPDPRPGWLTVQAGGGGLGMRIDRCTGAVSDMHYQR